MWQEKESNTHRLLVVPCPSILRSNQTYIQFSHSTEIRELKNKLIIRRWWNECEPWMAKLATCFVPYLFKQYSITSIKKYIPSFLACHQSILKRQKKENRKICSKAKTNGRFHHLCLLSFMMLPIIYWYILRKNSSLFNIARAISLIILFILILFWSLSTFHYTKKKTHIGLQGHRKKEK